MPSIALFRRGSALADKRVFITGANRGLGFAFVEEYLARGWHVIAAARDIDGATALQDLLSVHGERLSLQKLDLSDAATVAEAKSNIGALPIDVLLSNAALTGGPLGSFGAFDQERFHQACAVNAGAFMTLVEQFASNVEQSAERKIFAVSSRIGANPFYGYAEYFASKSALNALVKQVSIALAPKGIAVAAGHPGWVGTDATAAQGQAPLTPPEAAVLMMDVIDQLTLDRAGRFFDPDGSELPLVTQQHEVKFYSKPRDATR